MTHLSDVNKDCASFNYQGGLRYPGYDLVKPGATIEFGLMSA